jgi:hypothetical protein
MYYAERFLMLYKLCLCYLALGFETLYILQLVWNNFEEL